MRQAHTDLQLLRDEDQGGLPLALSLGFDFCAEHEYGIGAMRSRLGAKDDRLGIERHRLDPQQAMQRLTMGDMSKTKLRPACHVLRMADRTLEKADLLGRIKKFDLPDPRWDKAGYRSAWNESSFQVIATDPDVIAFLKDFEEAVGQGNAAVMPLAFSGNNPFSRASLSLVIIDRLPEPIITRMHETDVDGRRLAAEVKTLDFDGFFRAKGLRIHACSPRRLDAEAQERLDTAYPLRFWVNSWDDRLQTSWFTVEELQDRLLEIFPDRDMQDYWLLVREELVDQAAPAEIDQDAPEIF